MPIDSRGEWRRAPDTAFVDDGNRVVILDLGSAGSGRPQLLEGPSAAIWRELDGPRTTGEIVASLAPRYYSDELRVAEDIERFLHAMLSRGLVQTLGPSSARKIQES